MVIVENIATKAAAKLKYIFATLFLVSIALL
jgi:hypothetical protein